MPTIFIGSMARSYRRKAEEIHRKMLEVGELKTAIDENGNEICRKCGWILQLTN